ncbi:hypothetical protein HMI55_000278 [Coelomomyces lativittatus]|nr:hypothetical protein HMI55_000278 [Coelomomyces lativittatus]
MNSTEEKEKEKEKEEEKEESTLSLSSSPKRCIVVKTKIMGREKGTINHGSEKLKESPILHSLLASSSSMMPLVQLPSFSSLERKRNKLNTIPEEILMDPALNLAIEQGLPTNYNFEIYKTIHQIKKFNIQRGTKDTPLPYSFFINHQELRHSIDIDVIQPHQVSTESLITIVYQPQAMFRVRPVTRCGATLPGHTEAVLSVQFSPDGTQLASGSGTYILVSSFLVQTLLPLLSLALSHYIYNAR